MVIEKEKSRICSLSPILIDKISAGEVIEGPFSIIKELIENSLDAEANSIRIQTKAAGKEEIIIEDNGIGIHPEDMEDSITRHTTSKITVLEDLEQLYSYGFRGEALAAIASVSHLQIKSYRQGQDIARQLNCRGGKLLSNDSISHTKGTTITVSNLFYSTPARRKYLKADRTENAKNHKEIIKLALALPNISFTYFREGKEFAAYPAEQTLPERISIIFDKQLAPHLLEVKAEYMGLELSGYISSPEYFRANRDGQFSFVNKRPVEIKNLSFFVRKAYEELLGPNMQPYFFLYLNLDPARLDANVHPQKKEIRLLDQGLLHNLVFDSLTKVLRPRTPLNLNHIHRKPDLDKPRQKASSTAPTALPFSENLQVSPGYILSFHQGLANTAKDTTNLQPQTESGLLQDTTPQDNTIKQEHYSFNAKRKSSQPISEKETANSKNFQTPTKNSVLHKPKELQPVFSFQRHFGTILSTYVLAEGNDSLYIIDQHTAHERVNYEQNLNQLAALSNERQALLDPIPVNCLPDELERIIAHQKQLLANGFLVEPAGQKSYLIREIPPYVHPGTELDILLHLLHRVFEGESNLTLYKDYAAMKACKASIKKNDAISGELLGEILQALPKCKEPGRCPHGRPTMVQISRKELDRMFQRI